MCQSLVSWLHDGSHTIVDDFEATMIDDEQLSKYMDIFKNIFKELGHENHYLLMTNKVSGDS